MHESDQDRELKIPTLTRRRFNSLLIASAASLVLTSSAQAQENVWSSSEFGTMFSELDRPIFYAKAAEQIDPQRRVNIIVAANRLKLNPRPHDIGGILHLHDMIHGNSYARDYAENLAYEILDQRIKENDFLAVETDGYCQGLANAQVLEPKPKSTPTPYSSFIDAGEFNDKLVTYQQRAILLAVLHGGDIPMSYGFIDTQDPARISAFYDTINKVRETGMKAACQFGAPGFWGRSIQKIVGNNAYLTDYNDSGTLIGPIDIRSLQSVWQPLHLEATGNVNARLLNTTDAAIWAAKRYRNPEIDKEIVRLLANN